MLFSSLPSIFSSAPRQISSLHALQTPHRFSRASSTPSSGYRPVLVRMPADRDKAVEIIKTFLREGKALSLTPEGKRRLSEEGSWASGKRSEKKEQAIGLLLVETIWRVNRHLLMLKGPKPPHSFLQCPPLAIHRVRTLRQVPRTPQKTRSGIPDLVSSSLLIGHARDSR